MSLNKHRDEVSNRLIRVAKLLEQGLGVDTIAEKLFNTPLPTPSQVKYVYRMVSRAKVHADLPKKWGPVGSGGIAKCMRCKGSGKSGPATCLQCLGQGCARVEPPKVGRPLSEFYMRTGCALANVV